MDPMDRPLTSHREDRRGEGGGGGRNYGDSGGRGGYRGGGGRGGYRGGGGGRGGNYRGGGGGPPRGGGRISWRGGGGRGGGDRRGGGGRYGDPYHRPDGGRGGPRGGGRPPERQGNRFYAEAQSNDPRSILLKQLNDLLHQVGQLPSDDANANNQTTTEGDAQPKQQQQQRWVVQTMSQNVKSLSTVLCSKADLFLKPAPYPENDAGLAAGPLASSLVQAAAVGPLQTPVYACLSLAVQQLDTFQQNNQNPAALTHSGFAQRTVEFAVRVLARDIDALLLAGSVVKESRVRIALRVRLVLRYLGLLSQLGMVQLTSEETLDPVVTATNHQPVTLYGLLQSLVQAATLLHHGIQTSHETSMQTYPDLALLLTSIVCSTVPHLVVQQQQQQQQDDASFWQEQILQPLQTILETYQSEYEPGVGPKAILLKQEQKDETVGDAQGDDEEEDENDDEDDEEEAASNPVCDSLQDLHRCVQSIVTQQQQQPQSYRWALFTDAPWKALIQPKPPVDSTTTMDEEGENHAATADDEPLVYTGEPILLSIFPESLALTMILGGLAGGTDAAAVAAPPLAVRLNLGGIVVGRLPIFGPPASPDDEADDEDNMEDEPKSESLQAYTTQFGMVDRYFMAEAVRDVLLSHEPKVTDTGVEKGTLKAVAEQVWSIRQLILAVPNPDGGDETNNNTNNNNNAVVGLEFVIVEVILSLVVQASSNGNVWGLTYLSRILLELIKVNPAPMAAAIVTAVGTLVEDYMPALVPFSRHSLAQWFALHLIHSNYQWPADYWKHWEPMVVAQDEGVGGCWKNSKGAFVKDALSLMMENVSDPTADLLSLIPKKLGESLVPPQQESSPPLPAQMETLIQDLSGRIWDMNEEPFTLLPYLTGDELSESMSTELAMDENEPCRLLWRIRVLTKAFLAPAYKENAALRTMLLAHFEGGDNKNEDEDDGNGMDITPASGPYEVDALAQFVEGIPRYRQLFEGLIAKESVGEENDKTDIELAAESILLDHISESCSFSRTLELELIRMFVEVKILSPHGILSWSLPEEFSDNSGPPLRWWEPCESAISVRGRSLFTVVSDYGHMVMDDNDESKGKSRDVRNAETFITFAVPLLRLTVERTVGLLNKSDATSREKGGKPSKKLAPQDILVLEGCKQLVRSTRDAFFSSLEEVRLSKTSGFIAEIMEIYQSSEMTGPSLATLCSNYGSEDVLSIKMLIKGLERCGN